MYVSIADSGQIAVDMVGAYDFDLILMDVQMPVMNGLQATEAIRRLPGKEKLPLLAMTANAFLEECDACIQAGMNDHVTKPVIPDQLCAQLVAWINTKNNQKVIAIPANTPRIGNKTGKGAKDGFAEALAMVDGLDTAVILASLKGNVVRHVRYLRKFITTHGQDIHLMTAQLAAGDLEGLRQTAHALKGVAGIMGTTRVESLALNLEKAVGLKASGGSGAGALGDF